MHYCQWKVLVLCLLKKNSLSLNFYVYRRFQTTKTRTIMRLLEVQSNATLNHLITLGSLFGPQNLEVGPINWPLSVHDFVGLFVTLSVCPFMWYFLTFSPKALSIFTISLMSLKNEEENRSSQIVFKKILNHRLYGIKWSKKVVSFYFFGLFTRAALRIFPIFRD